MSNQLQKFQFTNNQNLNIRIINGEEYFLAKNVCDILDLGNTSQALSRVEQDDIILDEVIDSLGRLQKANFINEAGLYALIFQSRKPQAKEFKKWVFNEVLPQIRKTGKYEVNPFLTATKKDLLKLALEQEEKIETLQLESSKKQEIIDEYITIDNNKTYTETAKILHLKPNKFIEKLRNLAYISAKNIPYQRYINCGYFLIKKTISNYRSQTKHFESYLITPKGFDYFSKQKNAGIFDTIKI